MATDQPADAKIVMIPFVLVYVPGSSYHSSLTCVGSALSSSSASSFLVVGLIRYGNEGMFLTDDAAGMLIPLDLQLFPDRILGGPKRI